MILRWSPFKIVSVSAVLYPRWPPLLKIEISSNAQNCSILSQKVPKFELYKHNDELFNIYYGIFYELWTFTDFDRLCKLEKRGMKLKKSSPLKLQSQSQPNFAEMILRWSPLSQKVPKFELYKHNDELFIVSVSVRPVSKMAAITKNRNFFKWPKLLYFKPESAQIWTV